MKILPSFILSLLLLGFWSCSDNGNDPISSGYETDCTQELDCNSVCGGTAINDACGVCGGDSSTCNISYSETIQPIFNDNCIGCHGSSGGLSLSSYANLISGGNSGTVVTSEDGSGSLLIKKLQGTVSGFQMPKNQDPLDDANINLIEAWINEGAFDN